MWAVSVDAFRVSFWGDENISKSVVFMITQL